MTIDPTVIVYLALAFFALALLAALIEAWRGRGRR